MCTQWKNRVLNMFGTFESATNANVDLVDPQTKDTFRGGGGSRVGYVYKPPSSTTPKGMLLPSAEQTEKQWNIQISKMENSQLSENNAVLNSVGVDHWKATSMQMPPFKPTVMLKTPKSGEFRHALKFQASSSVPEVKSYVQKNAKVLASAASNSQTAAFFGLQQGLQQPQYNGYKSGMPQYKAQRPQQLLRTGANVQGQQIMI